MDAITAIEELSTKVPAAAEVAAPVDPEMVVPLRRPISWGGKTYTEIDLSGLESLCAEHLSDAHRAVIQVSPTAIVTSVDPLYSRTIVSAITGIPEVLLKTMDARDANRIQQKVLGFLND